jgi:putative FmdB family regulatory protein
MPIYEFRCTPCADHFEELVRRQDEAVRCPACGGQEVERLVSTFAGVGGGSGAGAGLPDYSRLAHHRHAGGCGCGHAH